MPMRTQFSSEHGDATAFSDELRGVRHTHLARPVVGHGRHSPTVWRGRRLFFRAHFRSIFHVRRAYCDVHTAPRRHFCYNNARWPLLRTSLRTSLRTVNNRKTKRMDECKKKRAFRPCDEEPAFSRATFFGTHWVSASRFSLRGPGLARVQNLSLSAR